MISYTLSLMQTIDDCIFFFVNGLHTPFFDNFMWFVSDRWIWIPLYILLTYMLFRKYGLCAGIIATVFIILTIAATDQTCASLIRPVVERLCPSNPQNPISGFVHIVNGYRGGKYGFPSCHAANAFALAILLSLYYRKRWFTMMMVAWATLVCYSRIYLGVHYPSDIIIGIAVGSIYAYLFYRLSQLTAKNTKGWYSDKVLQ